MTFETLHNDQTPVATTGVFFDAEDELQWKKAFKEAIKTASALEKILETPVPETSYSIFIPQKLANKIKVAGPNSSLWKQYVPCSLEKSDAGMLDPIGDQAHSPTNQLIHRYKNRALFLPTTVCPVICRYCFRKNELNQNLDFFTPEFEQTLNYLKEHTEINEIIFSGGDPFILTNEKLDFYLKEFSNIPHLRFIRFHTRTPIVMPERVTRGLNLILEKYSQVFTKMVIALHVNHKDELDHEVRRAIFDLNYIKNVELLSQTVLLSGINNSVTVLKELFNSLAEIRIRPYYLHHPDPVKGGMHFMLSIEEGRRIYGHLRDELPGWSIPQYVLDIPDGFGKVPLYNPEKLQFDGTLLTKSLETTHYHY